MNENKTKKLAILLLSSYLPAEDNTESIFVPRSKLIELLPDKFKKVQLSKILKFAKFKESFSKIDNITTRGVKAVINENGYINENTYFSDQPVKQNVYVFNIEEAIKYISDNWIVLKQYMTHDIIDEYNRDPTFKNMSSFKKRTAYESAGFVKTLTLFEEKRTIAQPPIPKNKSKKKSIDLNKLLRPEIFD